MRIWSIDPKYLDPKRLIAQWREAFLIKSILGNMKRLPYKTFQNIDTVSDNCFYIDCYSQLIFK